LRCSTYTSNLKGYEDIKGDAMYKKWCGFGYLGVSQGHWK